MLGYMTKRKALEEGFTHHGHYYGLPLWIKLESIPTVTCKWALLEPVMTAFHYIEGFVRSIAFPDMPPCFAIKVGAAISGGKETPQ